MRVRGPRECLLAVLRASSFWARREAGLMQGTMTELSPDG